MADTLKELDNLSRKLKTSLRAASGTLSQGEGDSIRKAVLSIVFKAMGLPAKFDEARALLWLHNEGIDQVVRDALKKNRELERELRDLTVSSHLHNAILAAKPSLARDAFELGDKLDTQFAIKGDITQDDFLNYFREAVSGDGEMPVFLLVIERSSAVHRRQRGSRHAHPGSGRKSEQELQGASSDYRHRPSALASTRYFPSYWAASPSRCSYPIPMSKKSCAKRFLRRKPRPASSRRTLQFQWLSRRDFCSPPWQSFAHRREDEGLLAPGYPLLPTRQRLWERVLATTDTTGTGVQLRSQLRLAFDAVRRAKMLRSVISSAAISLSTKSACACASPVRSAPKPLTPLTAWMAKTMRTPN